MFIEEHWSFVGASRHLIEWSPYRGQTYIFGCWGAIYLSGVTEKLTEDLDEEV
jgi:hypothetical protein